MTGSLGPNDSRPDGDALDRAIDEALAAELRGGPGDLRTKVLARLEEPVEDRTSRWWSILLRPALLPAAGAVLIVIGVAVSWWQVNEQLRRSGAGLGRAGAGRAEQPQAAGTVAQKVPASPAAPAPGGAALSPPSPAEGRTSQAARRNDRVFAASLLEMDALSRPKGIAAAGTVVADEDEPGSLLPGAVGGDLGDPIRPIPRPRPVVIPTLVAPPIVVAPIVDAPPVSTLATPVSTLSIDNSSRDQTGPGKSGGVRP
jgi:hypothetical protein